MAGKMNVLKLGQRKITILTGAALMGLSSYATAELADIEFENGNYFHLGGYARTWASVNLQDVPDTKQDDKGDVSMFRGSILLDATARTGPISWRAIGRFDREMKTNYVKRLEDLTRLKTPGGPGSHVMQEYDDEELREFYADFDISRRFNFRLGKQQVVWGETDFFRAMDLVNGYDFGWRSFLEPENEDLRKPLILANITVSVPEANGALQILVRPGWDKDKDIGNTYDLWGGRWTPQTFAGADFTNAGVTMGYDYHHPEGDTDDVTGGLRWTGTMGPVSYSLAYLKTFNPDPVINSAFAPYKQDPTNTFGDWIYPEIDVFGVTASVYADSINSVLSTEIVYIEDAPYNVGLSTPDSWFQPAPEGSLNTTPGFGGLIKKDTLVTMIRVDRPLNLKSVLGTSSDSFFTVQLFNKTILDFDRAEEIVDLAGYNAPKRDSSTILTAVLTTNFVSNTVNPSLAVGYDVHESGGFIIPSVEFVMGDKWRLRAEADLFFSSDERNPNIDSLTGESESKTHLFGTLVNRDQFLLRLTRLF